MTGDGWPDLLNMSVPVTWQHVEDWCAGDGWPDLLNMSGVAGRGVGTLGKQKSRAALG